MTDKLRHERVFDWMARHPSVGVPFLVAGFAAAIVYTLVVKLRRAV